MGALFDISSAFCLGATDLAISRLCPQQKMKMRRIVACAESMKAGTTRIIGRTWNTIAEITKMGMQRWSMAVQWTRLGHKEAIAARATGLLS